jgi:hypothetical protein
MSCDLSIDDDSVTNFLLDLNLRIPEKQFFPKIIEDFEQQNLLKDPLHHQHQQHSKSYDLIEIQQPNKKHLVDPVMKINDFVTTG